MVRDAHFTQTSEEHAILTQNWRSRQQAIDSIKYHSTKKGKRVLVDRKASSGIRVVMRCASSLSAGKSTVSKCNCKYRVVLRKCKTKGVTKPWRLKRNTKVTDLHHSSLCTAQGKITYRELKMNLKTTNNRVLPSIKQTRGRIARDSKVPQSYISPYVDAKTRLSEAKQVAVDYLANWSKLDGWGQQLQDRNPGSVVHVEDDAHGRFKRMFVGLQSASWVATHAGA